MFGKDPHVSSLAARKQLLIAESELNRIQLAADVAMLKAELRAFGVRAKSFRSIASSAAMLVIGLARGRQTGSENRPAKLSWPQTLLKGVGLISDVWAACQGSSKSKHG